MGNAVDLSPISENIRKVLEQYQASIATVDTFAGEVSVEWDLNSSTTPMGQLAFFIEFMKSGDLLTPWVNECPLELISNNAPSKLDVLGTVLLSVLSGHKRYAHVTAIRNDGVTPQLLGMSKIVSEDSVRRNLKRIDEATGDIWMQEHLSKCYAPLLSIPWILDMDTTVKTLYGKQEGAVVGYNPHKPGRPAHTYHTYSIANLRLILDVEVQAGNHGSASHSAPGLWGILDKLPVGSKPAFIRGDCAFGIDGIMCEAELRHQEYLFKLKQTKKVKTLIEQLMRINDWVDAGQGWEGIDSTVMLTGWKIERRVIVLRKRISTNIGVLSENPETNQLEFNLGSINDKTIVYEYAVLITSLKDGIVTISQHYRDRADCENIFDEMKNQWGWGGFTTQDLHRCKLIARIVALIYNWWNIFVRLAEPDKHLEAITSRPLLLNSIGKQTNESGKTKITICSMYGNIGKVKLLLGRITSFFNELKSFAEQLTSEQRWHRILSKAVFKYLDGKQLAPPICVT